MISLIVSEGYSPPYDVKESPSRNEYVLEIGNRAYLLDKKYHNDLNHARSVLNMAEIKEKFDQELKELKEENTLLKINKNIIEDNLHQKYNQLFEEYKAKHDQRIEQIKIEHEKILKERNEYLQLCTEVAADDIKQLKQMYSNRLTETISQNNERVDNLQQRLIEINDEHQKNISKKDIEIDELKNKLYKETLEIKKHYIQESKEREEQFLNTIAYERNRVEVLTEKLSDKKTISIAEIGAIGEETVEQWIRETNPNAEIINKSHETAKGDYHVKIGNKLFLIEVKNKKAIVNTDIHKFIRDVEENKNDIHAGIFITLNSPNIPNKGDFSLEYIDDIPVLYLHAPDKQSLKIAIKTLHYLNTKEDTGMLTLLINNIYTSTTMISKLSAAIAKNNDECKINIESLKKEIKTQIMKLDEAFKENPELKIDMSVCLNEFNQEEIKILKETYLTNKKAKMDDYMKALGVTAKYLQDRGGAAKIKSICTNVSIVAPKINFPVVEIPKLDI